MKKELSILLLLLTFSYLNVVFAQETYVPPSPTAISLIKGSQTDVNLYTGKANINIPICTVKEGSLSVNISLKYVGGSGIKVQEIPGEAGLGWSLMAGGLISRTNRDKPSGPTNTGFLKGNPSYSELQDVLTHYEDFEPDIFNSTVGGRIIFDENQKPHFMNEMGFKIQQDGVYSADRTWIIVDTRGNSYYFGETDASRERLVVTPVGGVPSLSVSACSWYLGKIVSANGASIQFEYEKSGKLNQFKYYNFLRSSGLDVNASQEWKNSINTLPTPSEEMHLSKIKTSRAVLQFLYSDRQDFINSKAISEIRVLDRGDKLLTKYAFETGYFKSADAVPSLRLKMKAIKQYDISSDEVHLIAAFNYNETENLPAGNSEKFDYWGYYNNNTTGKYFLTEGANKIADSSKCKANILSSIQWPTGGSTKYFYELNSYRKNGVDYSGGGLRVSAISEVDNDNSSKVTKYEYTSTSSGQKTTSGLLHNWFDITKGYISESKIINRFVVNQDRIIKTEDALPLTKALDLDGVLVGYSQVTVIHPDQSSDEYNFRDYAHFPDEVKPYSFTRVPFARPVRVEDLTQINNSDQYNGFKSVTSNAIQRGLITSKIMRNNKREPIKVIQYTYNIFTGAEIPGFEYRNIYSYIPPDNFKENLRDYYLGSLYFERVMAARLTEIKEDNYFPGTTLPARSTTITNGYKQVPRVFVLATQTQKQSNEAISTVEYNYPADMVSLGRDPGGVYAEMGTKNIIDPVIERTETQDGKQVSFTRTNYDRFNANNLLLPKSVEVQNGNNPIETRQQFNQYDVNGNILEQQQSNGIKTSYLWGYNRQYPVAKILSSTSIASTAIPQSKIDTATSVTIDDQMLRSTLSNFRNSLPGAKVWSYTYAPLIGMSSETDPNGITTYYEYDNFQRLKYIKNQDRDIIKDYSYNTLGSIAGNEAISRVFRKNNCSAGQYGEKVEFSVPANKYFAKRQGEADALAWNELTLLGQQNANTKGQCFQNGVYVSVCLSNSRKTQIGNYMYTYVTCSINVYSDHYGTIPLNSPVNIYYGYGGSIQSVTVTSNLNLGEREIFREYVGPMPSGTAGEIVETAPPEIRPSASYTKLDPMFGCGPLELEPDL